MPVTLVLAQMKNRVENRYFNVKQQFLRQLRGNEKQEDVSRKLGFKFNQFGKWESGFKQIKWKEFLFLCSMYQRDVKSVLRDLGLLSDGQNLSGKTVIKALLKKNGLGVDGLGAERIGVKKAALIRRISGESEASVETIFRLLDLIPGFLAFFTMSLLKGHELHVFASEIKELRTIDTLLAETPQIAALIGALHLRQNQESSPLFLDSLSRSMGVSVAECEAFLKLALKSGLIEAKGHAYKLNPVCSTQMLFAPSDSGIQFLRSLVRMADPRTDPQKGHLKNTTGNPNYFFAGLYSLSKEQAQQIAGILTDAAGKIESICAQKNSSDPPTDLRLVHFNYFDLRDLK